MRQCRAGWARPRRCAIGLDCGPGQDGLDLSATQGQIVQRPTIHLAQLGLCAAGLTAGLAALFQPAQQGLEELGV
ncbi:hypothetical protein LNV23_22395 [Paucibacter sp. DJ1R-11]|uniref:hypothetical protein n=1 Tax=Paucibacter sp. DJ1R-11 TaxID=2893556 RepID=UPI0021E35B9C|nr:hypothetical protein [Paucibacter sp. DJ1R-11]MCV2366196.1 hypothetical protein [Paucibacter sp. DJ1R-11]